MAIENTYREVLITDYIKEQISRGIAVSATDVEDELNALIADSDLSQPQFDSESWHVNRKENASASKFKNTFLAIRQDLRVLYKEMIRLADVSSKAFERWRLEASSIEKQLVDLEDRIENLLLLTQDTEGYHSVLIDNFTDSAFTDTDLSTTEIDLKTQTIEMGVTSEGLTRILLNDLDIAEDVSFKVRTTIDFLSRTDANEGTLVDPLKQSSANWWTNIQMKSQKPVTCEYTIRISAGDPIPISKIFVDLHHSAESSVMQITPLYSIDNRTYNQIPSGTFTQAVRTDAVFQFPEVQAKWIKLLLNKEGPDPSSAVDFFSYQFGFKEISFYSEAFDINSTQQFFSTPLWIISEDGTPREFEKATLEVCERVDDGTELDYYLTASNDPDVPVDANTIWTAVSPVNRTDQPFPTIYEVGDVLDTAIGDTESDVIDDEIVTLSYDGRADDDSFVNPGRNFHILSRDGISGALVDTEIDAGKVGTVPRYSFVNSNDRMLNYQIQDKSLVDDENLRIDENNLILFRNIGKKGFVDEDVDSKVRGIQRGWKFVDPYYYCVIEILNPNGLEIDVGDEQITIDDVTYRNKVDSSVLTGKSGSDSGIHTVRVHKNNWVNVTPDLTTQAALEAADPLYPYNHKLLIEGYAYDATYPDTEEKIYPGADLFAETVMTKVSIFDMINNIAADRYDVYALDRDAPKSHHPTLDNQPSRVFVLKVDENNPDFQNERFVIRFKQINELRKYLRLRADFSTEDSAISPTLHSYKIKLA